MDFFSFLDDHGIRYQTSYHQTAYTAQDLAMMEHIPGRRVIKPVVIRADGEFLMCALPASHRVDLNELRHQLQAQDVKLVDEPKLAELFPECQLGAEPPIGNMFGMTTLMDESLIGADRVTFQAGTHEEAVTMTLNEFRRIAAPEIAYFGRHL